MDAGNLKLEILKVVNGDLDKAREAYEWINGPTANPNKYIDDPSKPLTGKTSPYPWKTLVSAPVTEAYRASFEDIAPPRAPRYPEMPNVYTDKAIPTPTEIVNKALKKIGKQSRKKSGGK